MCDNTQDADEPFINIPSVLYCLCQIYNDRQFPLTLSNKMRNVVIPYDATDVCINVLVSERDKIQRDRRCDRASLGNSCSMVAETRCAKLRRLMYVRSSLIAADILFCILQEKNIVLTHLSELYSIKA